MRRMPSAPPNRPASKTTLSRGEAWPDCVGGDPSLVQSSWAKTNAAKSTSRVSSTSRSSVETPGLKTVVHGSTSAMSWSPRVSACSSFSCLPDEPRKMRGLFMRESMMTDIAHTRRLVSAGFAGSRGIRQAVGRSCAAPQALLHFSQKTCTVACSAAGPAPERT